MLEQIERVLIPQYHVAKHRIQPSQHVCPTMTEIPPTGSFFSLFKTHDFQT